MVIARPIQFGARRIIGQRSSAYSLLNGERYSIQLHDVDKFGSGLGRGLVPRLEAFEAKQMEAFEARQMEPRLPLPGPQELEAIKRVAQLLAAIGEQVIPAIIGDNPAHRPTSAPAPPHIVTDVPSDPVQFN